MVSALFCKLYLRLFYERLTITSEQFRQVVEKDFVKDNLWPELIPQLKLVIQSSNLISPGQHPEWNTINALTVLQSVVRPFQVHLLLSMLLAFFLKPPFLPSVYPLEA